MHGQLNKRNIDQPNRVLGRQIRILVSDTDGRIATSRADLARLQASLRATRHQIEEAQRVIEEFRGLGPQLDTLVWHQRPQTLGAIDDGE
jgi:hypothetical protein